MAARESTHKAVAGAIAGFIAAAVPVVIARFTDAGYSEGDFLAFQSALTELSYALVGAAVGWIGVYFAPRNRPIE